MTNDRSANGLRRSPFNDLSVEQVEFLKSEIHAIGADENVFKFNLGVGTSYSDELDVIYVRSDVLPDGNSTHPRDLMSPRAVLAHEYYGHRAFRGTALAKGAWNDEFRASYIAAKNAANLTDEDRAYLVMDAITRASDAGISIRYNDFMRGVLHGDDNKSSNYQK